MSKKEYYKGDLTDVIITIPTEAIELDINIKLLDGDKIIQCGKKLNVSEIRDAMQLFEDCCMGEYSRYILTERGKEYIKQLKNEGVI